MDPQGQNPCSLGNVYRSPDSGTIKNKVIFSLPLSPPANSLCSYALRKLIYFHARIIFLRASGLPNPREVVRKSRDFCHKAGLCSGQRCGRKSPLGNRAHALPREHKSLVKPAAGKIRILTPAEIMGRIN